jgi:hypothetical protein
MPTKMGEGKNRLLDRMRSPVEDFPVLFSDAGCVWETIIVDLSWNSVLTLL